MCKNHHEQVEGEAVGDYEERKGKAEDGSYVNTREKKKDILQRDTSSEKSLPHPDVL